MSPIFSWKLTTVGLHPEYYNNPSHPEHMAAHFTDRPHTVKLHIRTKPSPPLRWSSSLLLNPRRRTLCGDAQANHNVQRRRGVAILCMARHLACTFTLRQLLTPCTNVETSRASNKGLKRPQSPMFPMAATFRYHQALKFIPWPHEVFLHAWHSWYLRTSGPRVRALYVHTFLMSELGWYSLMCYYYFRSNTAVWWFVLVLASFRSEFQCGHCPQNNGVFSVGVMHDHLKRHHRKSLFSAKILDK